MGLILLFRNTGTLLFVIGVLGACATASELSDEDIEKRLETCKALGMPPIPCDGVSEMYAQRLEENRQREKDAEAARETEKQAERDAQEREIAKTLRLPPRGMVNPALEKQMLEAYAENLPEENLTPLRAIIVSKTFNPIRHEISGIVIGRGFGGVVAMRRPNGECFVASCAFEQQYDGETYTNVYFRHYSSAYPPESTKYQQLIECANVNQ